MDLKEKVTITPRRPNLSDPPGTTQGDLNQVAAHEQKVRDMIREYLEKTDAEWERYVEAGRPDPISVCLATGNRPNETMLRLIARARFEEELSKKQTA